jgi:hypothetical protein
MAGFHLLPKLWFLSDAMRAKGTTEFEAWEGGRYER